VYFWQTRALAEDLRAGHVSERQRMHYLLAHTVLMSGSIPLNLSREWPFDLGESLLWWIGLAINVAGVALCFEANHEGDDRDFVSRFICLSWPITVRLMVLAGLPVVALQMATRWPTGRGLDVRLPSGMFALAVGVGLPILYYGLVRAHIRRVAAAPSR
jgi:hypothetical protein